MARYTPKSPVVLLEHRLERARPWWAERVFGKGTRRSFGLLACRNRLLPDARARPAPENWDFGRRLLF